MTIEERDKLIMDNINIPRQVAKKYYRLIPFDEAFGVANLALVSEASKYDSTKHNSASSFLKHRCHWKVKSFLRHYYSYRRENKVQFRLSSLLPYEPEKHYCTLNFENILDKKLLYLKLHMAMHKISEEERKILKLYFWQGLSNKECADLLDLKLERVHHIKWNAYKKLRNELNS